MTRRSLLLLILSVLAAAGEAQTSFNRGDVVVSGYRATRVDIDGYELEFIANVRVHGRDGSFQRELITSTESRFSEPYVRENVVFVGRRNPHGIARIGASGNVLADFTTDVVNVNFLSPGAAGGLLAANGSGELYYFSSTGTLVRFRNFMQNPAAYGGIDLAPNLCTVFFATTGSVARWNSCADDTGEHLTPILGYTSGFRLLRDGSFLVALFGQRVLHLSASGTVIREYSVPGAYALALDIDGTSFWASGGNVLLRIDIATGVVLSQTFTEFLIEGLSVVGEPRAGVAAAAVPALSPASIVALSIALITIALLRFR